MEIGNQIRQLRQRRGITQEAMAQELAVTAQAVSKWERGVATPDISLLPDISAFFGVTIDELFALSDDTKMERIQNMLWDVRELSPADIASSRDFLLDKARREPNNGKPYALLADMENHIARWHSDQAANYAKEALQRDHTLKHAHSELTHAMRGCCGDWCVHNHHELIDYYQAFVAEHPDYVPGYQWLLDQLLDDGRLDEAQQYLNLMEKMDDTFRSCLFRAKLALCRGQRKTVLETITEMESRFPDTWIMYLCIGDIMVKLGDHEKAKEYWHKYTVKQQPPRYSDGYTSIAQLCQIEGDFAGAIDAIRGEIALLASDWNTTEGETVDRHLRKIAELEAKL